MYLTIVFTLVFTSIQPMIRIEWGDSVGSPLEINRRPFLS